MCRPSGTGWFPALLRMWRGFWVLLITIKELERALQERSPVQPDPPRTTSPTRAAAEGRSPPACYKCGEVGHFRRSCPRNSRAKATGNMGGDGSHPQRGRGPSPQTKGTDGQRPGTGDRAPRGPRTVRVLSAMSLPPHPRILWFPPPPVRIASLTHLTRTPRAPRLLVPLPHASGGGGSAAD